MLKAEDTKVVEIRNLRIFWKFPSILFVILLLPFVTGKFVYADDESSYVGRLGTA
jgi:hypothetical protein